MIHVVTLCEGKWVCCDIRKRREIYCIGMENGDLGSLCVRGVIENLIHTNTYLIHIDVSSF